MYVIPVCAASVSEIIPVNDELGVAEYFLERDMAASGWQKMIYAIASDVIFNAILRLAGMNPKRAFLQYIYNQLSEGNIDSSFSWGDEWFVSRYFRGWEVE